MTIDQLITEVRAQRNLPPPPMRRAIRQAAGVSMPRLAGALGVSTPTLHHWEIGTRNPRPAHAIAYNEALQALHGELPQGEQGENTWAARP